MNINKVIYNTYYSNDNLRLAPKTIYDKQLIVLRFQFIKQYGTGKDVLDLCCGTGSYLIPVLDLVKTAIGVDFSVNMLNLFRNNLKGKIPTNLTLLEEDATNLSIPDECFDFVFSYTSLYYIPNVADAINEVSRVLRHDGYAVLELGNLHSLNTIVCNIQHEYLGISKPFHISYKNMHYYLKEAGLEIVERHSFQILTMYGTPKRLFYLYPLLCSYWKKILGIQIRGKMLDEWISGSWPLRYLAFRHLFLVRKR